MISKYLFERFRTVTVDVFEKIIGGEGAVERD